jgi:histidine ammonia-lyase
MRPAETTCPGGASPRRGGAARCSKAAGGRVYDAVRAVSLFVEGDRELRADSERVVALIASRQLSRNIDG